MVTETQVIIASLVMLAVGGGFLYYLWRSIWKRGQSGALEFAAFGLSTMLTVCAGLLLFLALAGGLVVSSTAGSLEAEVGDPVPDFSFIHIGSGEQGKLSDYAGDVILVNIWATWCAPCLEELPALNRLYADYRDEGLTVLSVSDEGPAVLKTFMAKHPVTTVSTYLVDEEALPEPFILHVRPTSYVIDREGVLQQAIKGARDYAFFEEAIQPHL